MGLGKEMKCEYSEGTDANAVKSIAYVEGNKYKSTGIFAGATSHVIFDGSNIYMWQEGKTTGMKMTMACINDLKAAMPAGQQTTPGVQSPEDQFKNATNTSCSPSTDSVDFSAPSDVTFTDQCEMLKGLQQMKNKIPSGAAPANIPNMPKLPTQ
jgi:hypothetical protein